MSSNKKEKKIPEFGRPLVPYFLDGTDDKGEFLINEDLAMPNGTQVKQKDLFIPNGERSWAVREFKDGYFEYKEKFLDEVMQGKQESLTLVDKDASHFNANSKNTETFAGEGNAFRSPKRRNSQKQTADSVHYQNYETMMNKNRTVSPQAAAVATTTTSPSYNNNNTSPMSTPKKDLYKTNDYGSKTSSSPPQQIKSKKSQERQSQFAKKLASSYSSVESTAHPVESTKLSTTAPAMPALITPQFLLNNANKPAPSGTQPSPPKLFMAASPPREVATEQPYDVVGMFDEDMPHFQPSPLHVFPSPPHPAATSMMQPPMMHLAAHPPPPSFFPTMMPPHMMPQQTQQPPVQVPPTQQQQQQPPKSAMTEQELLASMSLPGNKPQQFFAGGSITASPQASALPKPRFKT